MTAQESPELWYAALTAGFTALIWLPYGMNRILEDGLWGSLQNPQPDARPKAKWAFRMINAHRNAIENLTIFATLAVIVHISGLSNEMTAMAAAIFFISRVAHLIIYTLGIPLLRTLIFFTGFLCQLALAARIFGYL